MLWIAVVVLLVHSCAGHRYIEVRNNNDFPIWVQSQPKKDVPNLRVALASFTFITALFMEYKELRGGEMAKLNPGEHTKYDIDDDGWAGRLWPKTGCDDDGNNCEFGQSIYPCPDDGCHPPAETRVEFFLPPMDVSQDSYYDISFVDGYSLGSEIIPYEDRAPLQQGSCIRTHCRLLLEDCPTSEKCGLGDLTVRGRTNKPVACLSPCKKWNYPAPYGMGRNEQDGDGRLLCCPSPVSVDECRDGIIENTDFVQLIRSACPSAYSYSYDDHHALHNCPQSASFVVNFYS